MIYLIGTYLFACRKLQAFSKKQDFTKKQAFSMTPILIESQNPVLKITFSHRTGKIGDSSLHTGLLGCQNVPKSTDKHLHTSAASEL